MRRILIAGVLMLIVVVVGRVLMQSSASTDTYQQSDCRISTWASCWKILLSDPIAVVDIQGNLTGEMTRVESVLLSTEIRIVESSFGGMNCLPNGTRLVSIEQPRGLGTWEQLTVRMDDLPTPRPQEIELLCE